MSKSVETSPAVAHGWTSHPPPKAVEEPWVNPWVNPKPTEPHVLDFDVPVSFNEKHLSLSALFSPTYNMKRACELEAFARLVEREQPGVFPGWKAALLRLEATLAVAARDLTVRW